MADLEQRVAISERETSELKARVAGAEEDMQSIPNLIGAEFRLTNSQFARLSRDAGQG
jgi:hypothetical protein